MAEDETPDHSHVVDVAAIEIAAMRRAYEALIVLDKASRNRALQWLTTALNNAT